MKTKKNEYKWKKENHNRETKILKKIKNQSATIGISNCVLTIIVRYKKILNCVKKHKKNFVLSRKSSKHRPHFCVKQVVATPSSLRWVEGWRSCCPLAKKRDPASSLPALFYESVQFPSNNMLVHSLPGIPPILSTEASPSRNSSLPIYF